MNIRTIKAKKRDIKTKKSENPKKTFNLILKKPKKSKNNQKETFRPGIRQNSLTRSEKKLIKKQLKASICI